MNDPRANVRRPNHSTARAGGMSMPASANMDSAKPIAAVLVVATFTAPGATLITGDRRPVNDIPGL